MLTLADFGLEPGMTVAEIDADGARIDGRWDGDKVVSQKEFARKLNAGEVKEGANFKRAIAAAQAAAAKRAESGSDENRESTISVFAAMTLESIEGSLARMPHYRDALWEAYVRRFIQVYKLNAEQSEKALAILHDCQQRAVAIVKRHAPTLEKLERRAEQASATGNKPDERAAEASKNARQQRDDAIQGIFDEQLKPRLEKLPTRAQRDAVEKARAASPATP